MTLEYILYVCMCELNVAYILHVLIKIYILQGKPAALSCTWISEGMHQYCHACLLLYSVVLDDEMV